MSSKKKRLAKGLGAGALAVATIVSGLSFGAASASATTGSDEVLGTMKFLTGTSGIISTEDSKGLPYAMWQKSSSAAQASRRATSFDILPSEQYGAYRYRSQDSGFCLIFSSPLSSTSGSALREAPCSLSYTAIHFENGSFYGEDYGVPGTWSALTTLNHTWQSGNESLTAAVGWPGRAGNTSWNDLPPLLGGVAKLTAAGRFDADNSKPAEYSGTANPNTRIEIRDLGNTLVASTTSDAKGNWAVEMPAPNIQGSLYTVRVNQIVNGTPTGNVAIDLQYGTRVSITSPADRSEAPAGAIAVSGKGEPNSRVDLFDNKSATPVATTTVSQTGDWSSDVDLKQGENVLEASQLSKGARTTTATVTVNPGQSALTAAEITTDEYTPGQRTTFAGTATAGATVDILDGNGSVIVGGVRVAEDGSFSFQHTPAANSTEFSFRVRQTLGDATRTDGPFTIDATVDAFAPVTVSRPATVTAGVENVFSGTATPNATYRVLNASGSQIVPGTFTIDADGNWTFRRAVSTGASKFDFKLEQTLNGETRTSQLFSIRANAGYTVTNTTRAVRPGVNNTFTGTGPSGASYRVLNMSGTQIVPGTFDIDGQGNWTFDRVVSLGAPNFKFKLEVTTADGATFTSPLYTVNAASLTPVTVDTTEVFPGRQNTFEGTGEPGATYSVLNMSDTVLDPSIESTFRVGQDGKWEFKRVVSMGAANFKFKIRQTLNGQTTTSDLFTIDAATFQAPTVDNEYVNAGIWNTFTGTVTPGATIRVLNTSNNELSGVTDLVVGADGKYSFKRIVGATSTKLDFRIEQTHLGKTMIGDTVTLQARTADVTIDNTTVTPGRVNTFTGTATPDATFQVFTVGNVGDAPLASGTVSAQGRFAFDRTVGAGATSYAFKIVLTKDGKQSVSAPFTITASTR
ncbi:MULTISPECIES: hypothetical protein [unclassified Curtobacterium]|uniref:hypothetical protein n=1 Tax=unclassified Curtobacterium TaxID=257496 RepID=UPI003A8125C0